MKAPELPRARLLMIVRLRKVRTRRVREEQQAVEISHLNLGQVRPAVAKQAMKARATQKQKDSRFRVRRRKAAPQAMLGR